MNAPRFEVVRGRMVRVAECSGECLRASDVGVGVTGNPVAYAHPHCPVHGSVRPLPRPEEFARMLVEKGDMSVKEAHGPVRELLRRYAAIWGNYEGVSSLEAQRVADELADELTLTADERQAESDFSREER
jgi:hypothetical protein